MSVITRRQAILTGLGFPSLLAVVPAAAFAPKEFWNEKTPSDWTDADAGPVRGIGQRVLLAGDDDIAIMDLGVLRFGL